MEAVHLDVAASNPRAIRCYEKVGFKPIAEVWRQAPDLAETGLATSRHAFLRPHVRWADGGPELRFIVMRREAR